MKKLPLRALFFVIAFMSAFCLHAEPRAQEYEVYSNSSGSIYLKAIDQFIPIAGEIFIPLYLQSDFDDIFIERINGNFLISAAPEFDSSAWTLEGYEIIEGDFDGDGKIDFFLRAKVDGKESLFLTSLQTSPTPTEFNAGISLGSPDVTSVSVYSDSGVDYIRIERQGEDTVYADVYGNTYTNLENPEPEPEPEPEQPIDEPVPGDLDPINAVGATAGGLSVTPSGAANYRVPLDLPPGINGLTPSVAIQYNSRAMNGLLGKGWSLAGFPAISLCGSKDYWGDTENRAVTVSMDDHLCMNGNRLRLMAGSYSYWEPGS